MTYQFKYKRRFFYRSIAAVGHRYDKETDKMVVFFLSGGAEEIPHWKDCYLKLGSDYAAAQRSYKDEMLKKPIHSVPNQQA